MPKISIIVPVYGVEEYLRPCVDSILSQTFTDFELILVDDGSPDNCGAICDAYAQKDNRVRVVHQKNCGVSEARNNGVAAANGEFISFVDGDDLLDPLFCEIMIHMLCHSKCDFAAARIMRVYSEDQMRDLPEADHKPVILSGVEYLEKQLSQGFSVCGKLFRRYVFQSVAFCPGRRHEDIIFPADLARTQKNGVCFTDAYLYYYRQNESSFMAMGKKQCSPDRVFAGEYLYNTVREIAPELCEKAFEYAVSYPWSFVDGIYVDGSYRANKELIKTLRQFLRKHLQTVEESGSLDEIVKSRMRLFSKSPILYGINTSARLLRVYLYHILKKDPYADGHGI